MIQVGKEVHIITETASTNPVKKIISFTNLGGATSIRING